MYSKISVFNMALGFMGAGALLVSDTDKSMPCVQLNLYFDLAKRTVLRDFPYSFAQKRKNLAEVEKPEEYGDFEYSYSLPNNCLKIHLVTDSMSFDSKIVCDDYSSLYRTFFLASLSNKINGFTTLRCCFPPAEVAVYQLNYC